MRGLLRHERSRALGGSVATGIALQLVLAVSGVLAARALGPSDRGRLALLTLVPSLIAQVGGLGLPLAVTQFVAEDAADRARVVASIRRPALIQTALLTSLHAAIVVALVSNQGREVVLAGLFTLGTIPAQFALGYAIAILQGEQRFLPFNVLRALPTTLYAALLGAAWLMHATSLSIVAALAVGPIGFAGIAAVVVVKRDLNVLRARQRATERPLPFRTLLGFGLKSALGSTSPTDSFRIDQLVVGVSFSPAALGIYVVAGAFMNLSRFIAQSIGMVAAPRVAAEPGESQRRRIMWEFVASGAIACGLASAALAVALPWLIPVLFGPEFVDSVHVGQVLVVASFLLGMRRVLTDASRGAGRPTVGSVAEVVSLIVLAPLVVLFIPVWGLAGVALGLAISTACGVAVLIGVLLMPEERVLHAVGRARSAWRRVSWAGAVEVLLTMCISVAGGAVIVVFGWAGTTSFLVSEVALLAVIALSLCLALRRGEDLLSPLSLVAAFYVLVFAVGGLYFWFVPAPPTSAYRLLYTRADLVAAVGLGLLGWSAFVIGYLVRPLKRRGSRFTKALRRRSLPVGLPVAVLAGIGWVARFETLASGRYFHAVASGETSSSQAGWLIATAASLPTLAVAYLGACAYLSDSMSGRTRFFFYSLFVLELAWAIPSGTRGNIAALGLLLIILHYYGRGTLPWRRLTAIGAVVVFVVMPFGLSYRSSSTAYQTSPKVALKSALDAMLSGGVGTVYSRGLNSTLTRLSPVESVSTVVHAGPHLGDLSTGRFLEWAVGDFVPRALLPSKGDPALYGNEFGRRYAVLRQNDYITSVAPTEVAEGYMIAGITGVIGVLAVAGFGFRLVSDALRNRATSPVALALYAVIAWSIFQSAGSVTALGLVGLTKTLLALALALGVAVRIAGRGALVIAGNHLDEVEWTGAA